MYKYKHLRGHSIHYANLKFRAKHFFDYCEVDELHTKISHPSWFTQNVKQLFFPSKDDGIFERSSFIHYF